MSVEVAQIELEGKTALGVRVKVLENWIVMIVARKGLIMCGIMDMNTAENMAIAGVKVTGVKTFNDVLNAKVTACTSIAKGLGIKEGMKVQEALRKLL